tara:strand:+ start:141 stop:362 length:222 start_codon:yes stop_codon:yes gene_type:complete
MTADERDPRDDPRTGDIIERTSSSSGKQLRRQVVMRDGMQVFYKTTPAGDVLKTWIMTWREWSVSADIMLVEE